MFNHFQTRFPSKMGLFLIEPPGASRASLLKDLAFPPVASPLKGGADTVGGTVCGEALGASRRKNH